MTRLIRTIRLTLFVFAATFVHISAILNAAEPTTTPATTPTTIDPAEPGAGTPAATSSSTAQQSFNLYAMPLGPVSLKEMEKGVRKFIFSDDGSRCAVVVDKGSRQSVYVDGQPGKVYQVTSLLKFSPDNQRVAYVAKNENDKAVVVVDGSESPPYDKVLFLQFSPVGHRLVYIARRGNQEFVVDDGKEGPPCNNLTFSPEDEDAGPPIRFSPDGKRLAYILGTSSEGNINLPNSFKMMVDGRQSPVYRRVSSPLFSPDSKHIAYVVGGMMDPKQLVYDGAVDKKSYAVIERFQFSDDGKHYLYVGRAKDGYQVVIDGKEGPRGDEIRDIAISPDCQRIAYVGILRTGTGRDRKAQTYVVENGKPTEVKGKTCGNLHFSADSKQLIYTLQGESGKFAVVTDGVESESFDRDNDKLAASDSVLATREFNTADGKHVAKVVRTKDSLLQTVIDDKPVVRFCLSEDGQHYAFASNTGQRGGAGREERSARWETVGHVTFDGKQSPSCADISDLAISPDGKHVAYVEGAGHETCRVVVDALAGPTFDTIVQQTRPQVIKRPELIVGTEDREIKDKERKENQRSSPPATVPEPKLIKFLDDGALDFVGVKDGTLYRCRYSAKTLASVPPFEEVVEKTPVKEQPGLQDAHSATPEDQKTSQQNPLVQRLTSFLGMRDGPQAVLKVVHPKPLVVSDPITWGPASNPKK